MKTSFNEIQETYLPLIDARFEEFFANSEKNAIAWNAEMSRYHFSTGGKRLRALIPCWVFAAFGKNPKDAISLGCALEMVHNATLVHDDLQDGDVVRRGKPTVWKKYSEPQSINCGDAMFQFAFQMLCEMNLDASVFRKIASRVTRGTLLVIEGQAQEFLMKDEEFPGVARYLGVVQGKTAHLIATAVVSAMEALGCSAEICAHAEKAALGSGILFQIQDDILDIYGDKARDRKATDIAEGKISMLVALFNESASPSDRARVSTILRTPRDQTTDEMISEVLSLFAKQSVLNTALQRIQEIQAQLKNDPVLAQQPEIHQLLSEMNQIFLKPISQLLP
jgi:geranylgeranyl pyrophosphate synthase